MRCPRLWMRREKNWASSFLHLLFFYSDPQEIGGCSCTLGNAIYFTESTNQTKMLISSRNTLMNTHRNKSLIWAPRSQSSWHMKLTITGALSLLRSDNPPQVAPLPRSPTRLARAQIFRTKPHFHMDNLLTASSPSPEWKATLLHPTFPFRKRKRERKEFKCLI